MLAMMVSLNSGPLSAAEDSRPLSEKQRQLLKTFVDEFVEITPGKGKFPASFVMGSSDGPASEQPPTKITFKHSFSIAKYEMPQNLYEAVTGSNSSRWTGPRNSAEMFDFAEVQEFCRKITLQLRQAKLLSADEEVRLPTEAEWEYCCRAGSPTKYSFGDEARKAGDAGKKATLLDEFGWHTGNAAGNDPPVGALKPNAWGLYDMHGYLWEFVADDWLDSHQGAPSDGSARRSKDQKSSPVIRGGSWMETFDLLTSSARRTVPADFKRADLGFRCVRAKVRKK
ncbi:MAG: sulfatase activating formylglycine-generating enzyme [Planctomycetaceae bacterium]|jgi:formylglycine-generating enzyme required for sulfatase activity